MVAACVSWVHINQGPAARVFRAAMPGTAYLDSPTMSATGFVLQWEGRNYFITNRHVCDKSLFGVLRASFSGWAPVYVTVEAESKSADLCLLSAPPAEIRPLLPAPRDDWNERHFVYGFALSNPAVLTEGYVSARTATGEIYTSIPTYPGNSGSPVMGPDGRVVGIAVQADIRSHYGYYIPLDRITRFLAGDQAAERRQLPGQLSPQPYPTTL